MFSVFDQRSGAVHGRSLVMIGPDSGDS